MSLNNCFSSSTTTAVALPFQNNIKHEHHQYYYHYYYAPMFNSMSRPFFFLPSMAMIDYQIPLKSKENLMRNSLFKLHRCLEEFLQLIDNSSICEFLHYDEHFRHADKYLLAMTFIYFYRAKLREHHYTTDSFYLALWLAHDSVEEDLTAKYGLLPWALQTTDDRASMDLKNDFKRFLSKKNDLWTRMGFRARVTKDQCDEIMAMQPNHWIWQRTRTDDYHRKMAQLNRRANFSDEDRSCSSSLSNSSIDELNSSNQQNVPSIENVDDEQCTNDYP